MLGTDLLVRTVGGIEFDPRIAMSQCASSVRRQWAIRSILRTRRWGCCGG